MLVASVHVPDDGRDDGRDDTAAMQRALDSLAVGQWLVFPAGTYLHNSRLVVASPAVEILARTTNIDNVYCEGLSEGGRVATDAACGGARPVVTGSTRSCLR